MKKVARNYGVWFPHRYYRTDDGHTFSMAESARDTVVFYHGNVITGEEMLKMLNEEEKKLLFEKVQFVD